MNSTVAEIVITLAAVAVIVVASVYVSEHVTCWHIPYFTQGCVVK